MNKFLVMYRSSASAREQMANATPEQAKAGMEAWMTWAGKAGDAIVDLGAPLAPAAHVGSGSGDTDVEQLSGFSILQSDSVDSLKALLDEHPHLGMPGSSIEVLEYLPIPGT